MFDLQAQIARLSVIERLTLQEELQERAAIFQFEQTKCPPAVAESRAVRHVLAAMQERLSKSSQERNVACLIPPPIVKQVRP
jgi:hypothetical protein